MTIGFDQAGPPATIEAIEACERRLGVSLPPDYRSFLQEQNGGDPEPNSFEGAVAVRWFLSVGPVPIEGLEELEAIAYAYSPEGDADYELPSEFLPVGEDDFGNLICLNVGGDDSGAVYFWSHDTFVDENPFTRLTDSFAAFFEALRPQAELDLG